MLFTALRGRRVAIIVLLGLPALLAGWLVVAASPGRSTLAQGATTVPPSPPAAQDKRDTAWTLLSEPERLVLQATYAVLEGRLRQAEDLLTEIIQREPNFQLAHALLADLRRVYAGLDPNLPQQSENTELHKLAEEWKTRLQALDHIPPKSSWPMGLVSFSPNNRHAFVLDASTLRLYWIIPSADDSPPTVVSSFYASVGKAGVGKEAEGDNKTPFGVYRVIGQRTADKLPEFYGAGALMLDYPNPVDQLLGRTGSGIWLHGTPPNAYTRDPLASEGCIVLANDDMRRLIERTDATDSLVLVVPSLQWQSEAEHELERKKAMAQLQAWARQTLGRELASSRLGIQQWLERNGHRYWRVEYLPEEPEAKTRIWYLRESEGSLEYVAGSMPNLNPALQIHALSAAQTGPATSNASSSPPSGAQADPVLEAVQSWAHAWSARDVQDYLAHYHPQFKPKEASTRADWETQRRLRIESRRHIEVEVLHPRVQRDGTRASVTFIQRYRADGQRELRTRKTMVLQLEGSRWLIIEERTG